MKLLLDADLSPKLVRRFADLFTADTVIWNYAGQNDFTIVTTDADFAQLAELRGAPPKVIRIERCDFRTAEVENLLRRYAIRIAEFNSQIWRCLSYASRHHI